MKASQGTPDKIYERKMDERYNYKVQNYKKSFNVLLYIKDLKLMHNSIHT